MTSERVQRRIERQLDQAEEAADEFDWARVEAISRSVLAVDAENADAMAFMAMAGPHLTGATEGEVPLPTGEDKGGREGSQPESRVGADGDPPRGDQLSTSTRRGKLAIPTSFANGRYKVIRSLGEGGKKRVYLAHDELLDRDVAFGLIKTDGFDTTSNERVAREAQAMGRLGVHPNIVAVLDLGKDDDGTPYMVTELMGGGDVEGVLEDAEENRLPLEQIIEMGKAICDGLEFAHSREIIHRDLKPGNVWLTEEGIAKIGDFGLAVMTDRSRLTREGMMVGTVSYMPPEQASGGLITPKADLYSLGAMLYEMVTGRPPFVGDDDIGVIGQHINTPPVAPTWHNSACPRPLEALLMRLLAKDPSERPDSAQDVFNALDTIDLTAHGKTVELAANSLESLAGGVFVGRQAEMDQLKAALEDVLGGRGRLVTLMGEPGIGKTRTSEELATYAGLRGGQVLWGRCYETGGQPPYWPWVQAIRGYVREAEPDELRRQLGSSASVVSEVITDVRDRLPEVQTAAPIDDPDSARFRLFDGITGFLKSASQAQPLVLVLDDLHWSDRPTLSLLEFVAREIGQSRLMIIGTYRDMELNRRHPLSVTLGDLNRERLYERVLLRGLTEQDIGRFIEIAAGSSPPVELSATVHRHTEGNPLFVTEVVRDLVQSGELNDRSASGSSVWSVRIPEGVREVIGRRLDRLSERANEVLMIAAVVGRDFTLDAIKSLLDDTSEGQLLDVLDEALDARIIEELSDAVGHYQFTHALMQETLTGELSITRRVRLHARVAEKLEQLYGDRVEEHAAELAFHFGEAEAVLGTDKLIRYSVVAGQQALDSQGYASALSHFETAVGALPEGDIDEDGALVLGGLGVAQGSLNLEDEAAPNISRAFDYWVSVGNTEKAVGLASRPWTVTFVTSAIDMFREATSIVPADSHEAGRLLINTSYAKWVEGATVEEVIGDLDRAAEIARREADRPLEIQAGAMRANVLGFAGRSAECIETAERVLDLVEGNSSPVGELRARLFLTTTLTAVADSDRSSQELRRFVERATYFRDATWIHRSTATEAMVAMLRGDWEELVSGSKELNALRPYDGIRAYDAAIAALATGDIESVRSVVQRLNEGFSNLWGMQGSSFMFLARISALMTVTVDDDPFGIDTPDFWNQALPSEKDPRRDSWWIDGIALATVKRGDVDHIKAVHERISGFETHFVPPSAISGTPRSLAVLEVAMGRLDDAALHFEDEIALARKGNYRLMLVTALADYANFLLEREGDNGEQVAVLDDEALALASELGMRPLTEKILARREILRA